MTKSAKHPTLAEVAKKAGVGTTTVSRVINGGLNVDPKTLARVQRAIVALGYLPNQAARNLKGGSTRTIGLVIPSMADPFFATCAEAAQVVVHKYGSVLSVLTTQNLPSAELEAIQVLLRHRVDGLIIAPCNAEDNVLVNTLGKLSMPTVTIDRPIAGSKIPAVLADNYAGARAATEHLLGHGYRKIVCLAKEAHLYTIRERVRGYREAMLAAGLKACVETLAADGSSIESCLGRILKPQARVEALFTLKNSITIDVFEILQRTQTPIPKGVALLGFDDFPLGDVVRPSISVIAQPVEEIGRAAAELLCNRIGAGAGDAANGGRKRTGDVQIATTLICRASCGCVE